MAEKPTKLEELESELRMLMAFMPVDGREGNNKVFWCGCCKDEKPLSHFLTSSKCWQAIQRKHKRAFAEMPADEQNRWTNDQPDWGPYCMRCRGCKELVYWEGHWTLERFRCPKCYAEYLRNEKNRRARKRYGLRSGRLKVAEAGSIHVLVPATKPKCEHCGKEFKAKRSDAKFCPGGKCRVAASRAKAAKTKGTKKRRLPK